MAQLTPSAQQQRMTALVHEIYSNADAIEMLLFNIFAGLSDGPWHQSRAIFFSQLNARARCDMIERLAEVSLMNEPDELEKIKKLIKRAKNAGRKRNTVTHGIWLTDNSGTEPEYRRGTISPDMRYELELGEAELRRDLKFMDEVVNEIWQYNLTNRSKWFARREAWRKLAK
jgi:hypothetical protein